MGSLPLWGSLAGLLGAWTVGGSAQARADVLTGLTPPITRLAPRWPVSLVVPAYNEERYIARLLESARNQTEPFYEVIVADCSDPGDATGEIARSYGAQVLRVPYGNIARSRNLGAAVAQGTVVAFADADMVLAQDLLRLHLDALEEGAVLATARLAWYDSAFWNAFLHLPQYFRSGAAWASGCQVMPAQVFWSVGGLDETCNPMEAWCLEMVNLAQRVQMAYGRGSVRLLGFLVGCSARRYQRQGVRFGSETFRIPVRAEVHHE